MIVGVNYPWLHCGWDFGEPPPAWDPRGTERAAWRRCLDADIAVFREIGLSAVRWFVLADGTSYGRPVWDPRDRRWRFEPVPLTPAFLEDYDALLEAFERAGLMLLPSLVGIGFFTRGKDAAADRAERLGAVDAAHVPEPIKGRRWDVTGSAATREAFFDGVLEPLLELSARRARAIYAWEIVNEPEWVTAGSPLGPSWSKTVDLALMAAFIREGAERVRRRGITPTVGFVRYETHEAWDEASRRAYGTSLGLGIRQFHHYPEEGERLPKHDAARAGVPAIVGELATRMDVLPRWTELGGADTVERRLALIARSGYDAAFVWSAQEARVEPGEKAPSWPDRATAWSDETRAALRRYVTGLRT